MDIFESLENLNVSEECFDEIMGIVEELINEDIYHAIQKYKTTQDKGTLMNKAYDNKEKELYTTAKREQKPEEVKVYKYADGSTLDDGIHKTMNRIRERRNPENKQAQNIMNKGVAKSRAGMALKDEMKDKNSGTRYANKEKEKLANKLIKQGDKEFAQGADQYQASHVPVNVIYKDGKRTVELRKKNKYD